MQIASLALVTSAGSTSYTLAEAQVDPMPDIVPFPVDATPLSDVAE